MSTIEDKNKQVFRQGAPQNFPQYDKDFGHYAESIIINAIMKELEGEAVEIVEKGTEEDDKVKKIDFWIKFKGVLVPIGIQYTISDSEEVIKKKETYLKKMNYSVPRGKRTDSRIDWHGNATAVLVRGNKETLGHYFEGKGDSTDFPDKQRKEFVQDFFSQLFSELRRIGKDRELSIITGPFLDYQKRLMENKKKPRQ